jgi:ribulose bisphosphate carboxylase small subunit
MKQINPGSTFNLLSMKHFYLLLLFTFLIVSCGKNEEVINKHPAITSITPTSGGYNTIVTITGSNFSTIPAENKVTINGVNAVVQSSTATTLKIVVPALTEGDLPIKISTTNGSSSGFKFRYTYSVFVSGFETDNDGIQRAKIWQNGIATQLSDISNMGQITDIAFKDNDFFACGNSWFNFHYLAKSWKNGVLSSLSDGAIDEYALKMRIFNNNIYVVGYEFDNHSFNKAKYWKDGKEVIVTNGQYEAIAKDIAVIGNDVYVVGNENVNRVTTAKYWKNGVAFVLGDGKHTSSATGIAVSGNDFYITGYEYNDNDKTVIRCWKNGVNVLSNGPVKVDFPMAITISNGDVYIAGYEWINYSRYAAKYWKNGVEHILSNDTQSETAKSITLFKNDIYIVGTETKNGKGIAKYWKNGVAVNLTNGERDAGAGAIIIR